MAPSPLAVACRYSYDPLDRLASSEPSNQAEIRAFYQKSRLATEIQGSLQRTLFQHDDYLLAQQQRTATASETSLLATDQQRSVLQRTSATERESLVYTAYGHHPADSGLSCLSGFNGERQDPVTGHYLLGNGYRAFNPVLMRFNSPDSLSPFGKGGLNAYAYCQGDPVNFRDPTGHMFKPILPAKVKRIANPNYDRNLHTPSPQPGIEGYQLSWPMPNNRPVTPKLDGPGNFSPRSDVQSTIASPLNDTAAARPGPSSSTRVDAVAGVGESTSRQQKSIGQIKKIANFKIRKGTLERPLPEQRVHAYQYYRGVERLQKDLIRIQNHYKGLGNEVLFVEYGEHAKAAGARLNSLDVEYFVAFSKGIRRIR